MSTPADADRIGFPGSVTIDNADIDDLPAIYEIETRSFPTHWSYRVLRDEVRRVRPQSRVLVARCGDRVVAFTIFWIVVDEVHILNFAVHPAYRRLGIAKRLLHGILSNGRALGLVRATLEVRVSNSGAIRLYREAGFRAVAMRRKYYQDTGEDAYVMWLDIADGAMDRPKGG
ncbi:ribosomal protein S18-alanine N-acetyltransferase [Candidatus Poribacteria bacterium]|jgi:[ribosomal protein S18]-alanine N-acetyltransferase|nr:ribosomal protein S18-alanine N-acetyltransferase [Candidatus Poribacteria bacterium]MBT5535940.1 ribosomal protein S18-alanine N-acetyltransferase [Candidatus Poribacteria bacterium]MBT5712143.1 ribosomal protein S18-alanine N-acetyltransferase [Candidatus Poribacteria bacterium]MBT7099337.1 ribosomal protein S18-alanine N-acetyltransferase [Candidatus Poribacteria bacterium]MBT7805979.1 ribosomal protein S18-alanine N-acetyltransferase [Candidatus Poribacteria bacterium]